MYASDYAEHIAVNTAHYFEYYGICIIQWWNISNQSHLSVVIESFPATDSIDTACRAELRRIGHALHAANPEEDFVALSVEIAEMDPTQSGWRAIVLEMVWNGIGGRPS